MNENFKLLRVEKKEKERNSMLFLSIFSLFIDGRPHVDGKAGESKSISDDLIRDFETVIQWVRVWLNWRMVDEIFEEF